VSKVIRLPKGGGGGTLLAAAPPTTLGQRTGPATGTRVAVEVPQVGWARLAADDDPKLSVLCELGDGMPRVTQGYGGFDEVERRGDVALTPWKGFQATRIELPLMLDDLVNGRSVEDAVDILEALAGRGRKRTRGANGAYTRPPQVIVHTAGVMPYDAQSFPDERWLVDGLDWDDEEAITNDAGNRVRAPVTVQLLQATSDTRLQDRWMDARIQLQSQSRSRRVYTAKQGDTAMSIARRELGDAGRYREILTLNHLRDPRAIKTGARIVLP
jgi:nucleoid-associated protein YgaU